MSSRIVFNSAVQAGQLIKFSTDSLATVMVINRGNAQEPYAFALYGVRTAVDASSSIERVPDFNFAQLKPDVIFEQDSNVATLTRGGYAVKANIDGIFTVIVSEETEAVEVVDVKQGYLDRLLTQYRESPNLIGLITAYLCQVEDVQNAVRDIPRHFNLDIAVGDQLTILGKWLGFPRCHNVTSSVPVFGFNCDGVASPFNIRGFCEGAVWADCGGVSSFEVCITQDELYRRFLYVRRYQLLGQNDYRSFLFCIRLLFGSEASYQQNGRVIEVSPGRDLTAFELTFLQVFVRVLPRALNATINITV